MNSGRKLFLAVLLGVVAALPVCATKDEKPAADAKDAAAGKEVVGYVAGAAITKAELEDLIRPQLAALQQQEYELRRSALEQLMIRKLAENEAAKRGITLDQLGKVEIQDKVTEPTDDQIAAYFQANKDREATFRNKTLDDVKPLIVQRLKSQQAMQLQQSFIASLKQGADMKILLDVPRKKVAIPAGTPTRGKDDAPITLVEFADFQCGYCKRAHPVVEQILSEYGDKVRYVYMDYPLNFHERAMPATKAALCAGEQGKYWEYHENLWNNPGSLDDNDLEARAKAVGLDTGKFDACYASDRFKDYIDRSLEEGSNLGVTGTPTFFINGRMMVGAKPYDEIKSIIDEELARGKGDASKPVGG